MIQEIRLESGIRQLHCAIGSIFTVPTTLKAMLDGNDDDLAAIQQQHQIVRPVLSEIQFCFVLCFKSGAGDVTQLVKCSPSIDGVPWA